jgi:hypothetical protein
MGNKNGYIVGYDTMELQVHRDDSGEPAISIHGHNYSDDVGSGSLYVGTSI